MKDISCHLHMHSQYSMIDGVQSPKEMVKYCVERGAKYISLTEHGHLSGLYQLEQACKEYNVQPICSCEFYVNLGDEFQNKSYGHLTTHSYNDEGYKNILKLYNLSWDKVASRFGKAKPMITWEHLKTYSKGLFVGSSCLIGVVARCLMLDRPDIAEKNLDMLIDIFGKDKVFCEIIPHQVTHDYNRKTGKFERNDCRPWAPDGDLLKGFNEWIWYQAVIKRGLKPVITTDAHFTVKELKSVQDAILMNGETGWSFSNSYYILKPQEMYDNLLYLPDFNESLYDSMIENALFFCEPIKYSPKEVKIHLPYTFDTPEQSYAAIGNAIDMNIVKKICC